MTTIPNRPDFSPFPTPIEEMGPRRRVRASEGQKGSEPSSHAVDADPTRDSYELGRDIAHCRCRNTREAAFPTSIGPNGTPLPRGNVASGPNRKRLFFKHEAGVISSGCSRLQVFAILAPLARSAHAPVCFSRFTRFPAIARSAADAAAPARPRKHDVPVLFPWVTASPHHSADGIRPSVPEHPDRMHFSLV